MSPTARDAIERYLFQVPRLKAEFEKRLADIGGSESPRFRQALEDEIRLRFDRVTSSLLEALDAGWRPTEDELRTAFMDALNAPDYRYFTFNDINNAAGYIPGKVGGPFGDLVGQTMVASSNEAQSRLKMHLRVLENKAAARGVQAPQRTRARGHVRVAPFRLTQIELTNYKSIKSCSVPIQNVTVLVGPNGAGKSNFLDCIRFVNEALYDSLEFAIRERGGMAQLLRQEPGWESLTTDVVVEPEVNSFEVSVEFTLEGGNSGKYRLRISEEKSEFYVLEEECWIDNPSRDEKPVGFTRRRNSITADFDLMPIAKRDRLFLATIASVAPFDEVFEGLTNSTLYRFDLDEMRDAQPIDSGNYLAEDGWNIASVVTRLQAKHPRIKRRIEQYLETILAREVVLRARTSPPYVFLEFAQSVDDSGVPLRLLASSISDGTLRASALLVALFQPNSSDDEAPIALVAFEEPETGLQPGALRVLYDAVMEASDSRQVLFTTHSPDLLDNRTIGMESILAVAFRDGSTQIGKVNDATVGVVRDGLATAGEMLRNSDSLRPE